jgi:hypothetical protein
MGKEDQVKLGRALLEEQR